MTEAQARYTSLADVATSFELLATSMEQTEGMLRTGRDKRDLQITVATWRAAAAILRTITLGKRTHAGDGP